MKAEYEAKLKDIKQRLEAISSDLWQLRQEVPMEEAVRNTVALARDSVDDAIVYLRSKPL